MVNLELMLERPDLSRINVLANVTPLRDATGVVTGAVSIFQNIDELKRNQHFPWGKPVPSDPTRHATDITWGWDELRKDTGVSCRLHDLRHTFATHLAENGVSESRMLALMGHMSRAMLERYSHIRMTAKRDAVAGVVLRPKAKEAENSELVPVNIPVAEQAATIQ
jgi:hypothetical protein